jgi:hypothetical protein
MRHSPRATENDAIASPPAATGEAKYCSSREGRAGGGGCNTLFKLSTTFLLLLLRFLALLAAQDPIADVKGMGSGCCSEFAVAFTSG